jgi:anti-anti-sigma factor
VPNDDSGILRFKLEQRDEACVLTVHGEIDMASAPDLTEAVGNALRAPVGKLVLDLRTVAFMSSAGLAVLLETHQRLDRQGGRLTIVADNDATSRTLDIAGLGQVFTIHRTLEAAITTG